MKILRRFWGLIALALLILLIILLIPTNPGGLGPDGSVRSTDDAGAAALELWLESLDYETERMEYREFVLTPEDDALLLITPSVGFSRVEIEEAIRWVSEDGGTLIMVLDWNTADGRLLSELELEREQGAQNYLEGQPALTHPFAHPPVSGDLGRWQSVPLRVQREDAATLAVVRDRPALLAIPQGRGLIYVATTPDLLTNGALKRPANAALTLNLLNRVPQGGRILFDEIHHGFQVQPRPQRPAGPSPLASLPFWTGLIYAVIVLGLYAILTGRRFGKPVPLREEVLRRSSAEYVQSMAGMLERGRKTGYVLHHYKEQLKRRLAKLYGFSPRLQDADFVRELARFQKVDEQQLLALLARMSAPSADETTVLRLVAEADRAASAIEAAR